MKNIIAIFLLQLLILSSCSRERKVINSKFPESVKLNGEYLSSVNSYLPSKLFILDSLLVVQNKKGPSIFQAYNTRNFEETAEFGTFGKGPDELTQLQFTGQVSEFNGQNYHHFFEGPRNRICKINIQECLTGKGIKIRKERINRSLNNVNKIIYDSECFLFAIPVSGEGNGRFQIYNKKEEQVDIIPYVPKLHFKCLKKNLRNMFITSGYCVNEIEKKIVLTSNFLGKFDFFDFSGDYLYSTYIDKPGEIQNTASTQNLLQDEVIYYHVEIQKHDSLIYALYHPNKVEELNAWKRPSKNSKILVLDWSGKPIREYILDKPISAFAYDDLNRCFYGYCLYEKLHPIIKYNIE